MIHRMAVRLFSFWAWGGVSGVFWTISGVGHAWFQSDCTLLAQSLRLLDQLCWLVHGHGGCGWSAWRIGINSVAISWRLWQRGHCGIGGSGVVRASSARMAQVAMLAPCCLRLARRRLSAMAWRAGLGRVAGVRQSTWRGRSPRVPARPGCNLLAWASIGLVASCHRR